MMHKVPFRVQECLPCEHWCVGEFGHLFCQWYADDCNNIEECPVRSLKCMRAMLYKSLLLLLYDLKKDSVC